MITTPSRKHDQVMSNIYNARSQSMKVLEMINVKTLKNEFNLGSR